MYTTLLYPARVHTFLPCRDTVHGRHPAAGTRYTDVTLLPGPVLDVRCAAWARSGRPMCSLGPSLSQNARPGPVFEPLLSPLTLPAALRRGIGSQPLERVAKASDSWVPTAGRRKEDGLREDQECHVYAPCPSLS